MLSGGKDSLAALSLARPFFKRLVCRHLYIVRGLRFIERHLERIVRQFDVELDFKPDPTLANYLNDGLFTPPRWNSVKTFKYAELEQQAREHFKAGWVIDGQRQDDSVNRRIVLRRYGAIDRLHRRVHPLSEWNEGEVYAYLRLNKVPLPQRLGDGKMSGFGLSARYLREVKERFPDDYRRILEVFPFAEAALVREELFKEDFAEEAERIAEANRSRARAFRDARKRPTIEVPAVRVEGDSSAPDAERAVQPAKD